MASRTEEKSSASSAKGNKPGGVADGFRPGHDCLGHGDHDHPVAPDADELVVADGDRVVHCCLPGSMRRPVICGCGRLPRLLRFSFARSERTRLYSATYAMTDAGMPRRGPRWHDAPCSR